MTNPVLSVAMRMARRLFGRLGYRLVSVAEYDDLQLTIHNARDAGALQEKVAQALTARADEAAEKHRVAKALLDQERGEHQLTRGKLSRAAARGKTRPSAFVVLTTVSQVPQLLTMIDSGEVTSRYDLNVIFYFPLSADLIARIGASGHVTLYDYVGRKVLGEGVRRLDSDMVPISFSEKATGMMGVDERQADIARAVMDVAGEIAWQFGIYNVASAALFGGDTDLLILFEDNAGYGTSIWVQAARRAGVASVILPYAIIDMADAAEANINDPRYWPQTSIFGRIVETFFSKWVTTYRSRPLLRRDPVAILAAETLGGSPPDPWIWNSTKADAIAVESRAMMEHYIEGGISREKLVLTGSFSDNVLYRAATNDAGTKERLGLDSAARLIVCGFPPDQLGVGRDDPEFKSFTEIVDAWVGAHKLLEGWTVVVKPHPNMRAGDIDLLKQSGAVVTDLETAELIGASELFVTSVSSTIRWALARGIPAINYDVYRYHYRDFALEDAVVTVDSIDEFRAALQRFANDDGYRALLGDRAGKAAEKWGMVDGQSVTRIVALFDRLSGRRETTAA